MKPKAIVIHCSASRWGDVAAIDSWHKGRGWSGIGYHAVVLNGRRKSNLKYTEKLDGKIEPGRPEDKTGAHCAADRMNFKALGVCLIGVPGFDEYPTKRQEAALVHYLAVKCRQYGIPVSAITQHSDHDRGKPYCASVNLCRIRGMVAEELKK